MEYETIEVLNELSKVQTARIEKVASMLPGSVIKTYQKETSPMTTRINEVVHEVLEELDNAMMKFCPYNSPHEGYAVILEELDELWDEIKDNKVPGSEIRQREEAIQVAATAIRFILDVTDFEL